MARGTLIRRAKKSGGATYDIKYRTADGTQVKRAVGPSRKEAEKALNSALAAVDRGEIRSASRETFAEAADAWLRRKKPLIEPSTHRGYEIELRTRLKPAFGHLKLRQISGIGSPKGDRGRTVLVAPYLLDLLSDHRSRQAHSGQLNKLVFTSPRGAMLNRHNVRRRGHDAAIRGACLPPALRLHDLRHTAATIWLASGESIYFVQQQLGHKDIQTTIDLYGHPARTPTERPPREQPRGGARTSPDDPGTTGGTRSRMRRAPSCPEPASDAASRPLPWHRDRSAGTRVQVSSPLDHHHEDQRSTTLPPPPRRSQRRGSATPRTTPPTDRGGQISSGGGGVGLHPAPTATRPSPDPKERRGARELHANMRPWRARAIRCRFQRALAAGNPIHFDLLQLEGGCWLCVSHLAAGSSLTTTCARIPDIKCRCHAPRHSRWRRP